MDFDSRQYEFADLALILGGVDITGFRAIRYTERMETDYAYGKGRYPHSLQQGNYSIDGEIVLLQSEYEMLVKASPRRSILFLQLTASIAYGGNPEGGATSVIVDNLIGVKFTEAPKSLNQGDMFMEITLPFKALRLKNNVK